MKTIFNGFICLFIVMFMSGCASLPAGEDYNWDEWQENTIQLSDATFYFEAPANSYPPLTKKFETEIDIYDESSYTSMGHRNFVDIGWYFMPQQKVRGELILFISVHKRPDKYLGSNISISDYIERQSRDYYETPGTNGYKYGTYIPMRFKYVAKFSQDGPKWLVYDYEFSGAMSDFMEICMYPLDETYNLSVIVKFINNTQITETNPNTFQPWYDEALAIADRILASTRIERTTPLPDVEYGAPYIGVIDSSRISYVDRFSERPPIDVSVIAE